MVFSYGRSFCILSVFRSSVCLCFKSPSHHHIFRSDLFHLSLFCVSHRTKEKPLGKVSTLLYNSAHPFTPFWCVKQIRQKNKMVQKRTNITLWNLFLQNHTKRAHRHTQFRNWSYHQARFCFHSSLLSLQMVAKHFRIITCFGGRSLLESSYPQNGEPKKTNPLDS